MQDSKPNFRNHKLKKNTIFKYNYCELYPDDRKSIIEVKEDEDIKKYISKSYYENYLYKIDVERTFPLQITITSKDNTPLKLDNNNIEAIINNLLPKRTDFDEDGKKEVTEIFFKNNLKPFFTPQKSLNNAIILHMNKKENNIDHYLIPTKNQTLLAYFVNQKSSENPVNNYIVIYDLYVYMNHYMKITFETDLNPTYINFSDYRAGWYNLVIFSELSNAKDYYSIDIYHLAHCADVFIFQRISSDNLKNVDLSTKVKNIQKLRFIIKKNSDTTLEMINVSGPLIFLTKKNNKQYIIMLNVSINDTKEILEMKMEDLPISLVWCSNTINSNEKEMVPNDLIPNYLDQNITIEPRTDNKEDKIMAFECKNYYQSKSRNITSNHDSTLSIKSDEKISQETKPIEPSNHSTITNPDKKDSNSKTNLLLSFLQNFVFLNPKISFAITILLIVGICKLSI